MRLGRELPGGSGGGDGGGSGSLGQVEDVVGEDAEDEGCGGGRGEGDGGGEGHAAGSGRVGQGVSCGAGVQGGEQAEVVEAGYSRVGQAYDG